MILTATIRDRKSGAQNGSHKPPAAPKPALTYFFIRHQGRSVKVRVADIDYIEARKNYCRFVTKTGTFLTVVTLKRMVEVLPPDEFCQIHRAFIVSLDWINSFDRAVVYGPDHTLPIGEVYRAALQKKCTLIGREFDALTHAAE